MAEPTVNINKSSSGDTTLVNAPGGANSFIRVWGYEILGDGTTTVSLKSGSTTIVGPVPITAGGGLVKNIDSGSPAFDCAKGQSLVINQTGTAALGGSLQYSIVMR